MSINETTANGTGILNLTVTDTDFDTVLDFGILNGNNKNVFAFNLLSDNLADSTRTQYQATGQLSVIGPLSYENTSNYSLVLFAFDTLNRAQITVNINLIPQNTKAPIFNLNPGFVAYEYRVTEGTAVSSLGQPVVSKLIHWNRLSNIPLFRYKRQILIFLRHHSSTALSLSAIN